MYRVYRGAALFVLTAFILQPVSTSAATQSVVGQQITITAAVKPHRYVVVDPSGVIQQIISNTSSRNTDPEVYVTKVAPENMIAATDQIRKDAEELLTGKKIEPGVLYDRKTEPLAVKKLDFIELLNNSNKNNLVSYKQLP